MEPIIKSEPCEALYGEQENSFQNIDDDKGTRSQSKLKRLYEEMEDLNQRSKITNYQIFEMPSVPQNFKTQEVKQAQTKLDGKQLKKFKGTVLFNAPFFNLVSTQFKKS